LLEPDRVIVATGGKAVLVALNKATGKPIWETPNPEGWRMTHASVMPAEFDGVKQYLYCTLKGALGIRAADGALLWTFPWKFNVAVPVSPVAIGNDRVFLTSCYKADTVMVRVKRDGEKFTAEKVFSLTANDWNSETHTPILHDGHLFAVGRKRRGLFTCLDLDGKQIWTSQGRASFGLGSYILADGMFFVLEGDTGKLRLLAASTSAYRELASAQVLSGHDVWAPMALSRGRLVIRDLTRMVCLDVSDGKADG
jgi:outer membrane protein assembly factor BamB